MEINDELYQKLYYLGVINDSQDNIRRNNVGSSDYSKHIIQPWSVWLDWNLNPWDADIVKRICRHKDGEDDKIKYEKIIHICKERLRQINNISVNKKENIDLGE
jgi:hypothetical protein